MCETLRGWGHARTWPFARQHRGALFVMLSLVTAVPYKLEGIRHVVRSVPGAFLLFDVSRITSRYVSVVACPASKTKAPLGCTVQSVVVGSTSLLSLLEYLVRMRSMSYCCTSFWR